eukprot:scaffold92489_cov21-Tisochrysis_lutea.AAC.3
MMRVQTERRSASSDDHRPTAAAPDDDTDDDDDDHHNYQAGQTCLWQAETLQGQALLCGRATYLPQHLPRPHTAAAGAARTQPPLAAAALTPPSCARRVPSLRRCCHWCAHSHLCPRDRQHLHSRCWSDSSQGEELQLVLSMTMGDT